METIGEDGSKTELVIKKKGEHKSMTGIGASLTPDSREKEESNNNNHVIPQNTANCASRSCRTNSGR